MKHQRLKYVELLMVKAGLKHLNYYDSQRK